MMRFLIFLSCLFLAASAYSAEGARCEAKSRNVQQCAIPTTADKRTVKISDQLTATFSNYKSALGFGIFMQFHSGKDVLQRVFLSFDEMDKESANGVIVDLRKKMPVGAVPQALEFEGTRQSVTVRLVHLKDGKIGKVDVFGAN